MRLPILGRSLGVCIFAALVPAASAQIIAQWTFNSVAPDASSGTGSFLPSTGSGTASVVGALTASFAAGSPRDAASDNSAWSLTGWPAQSVGSGTAGAQFMASTAGFTGTIQVSFDLRQTTTASERFQLQATADGVNFANVSGGTASFGAVGNNTATAFDTSGLFVNAVATSSQAFVQSVTYTFLAGSAFEDNANFGFRLVSVFEDGVYDAAGAAANYGTTGTLRLDMVTVSAASAAVPEPSTSAIFMGMGALAAVMFRRSRQRRDARSGALK